MNTANRLKSLRDKLVEKDVDGYIIPRNDAFQGEYVPASAERLAWLTGFTGSAGFSVVTKKEAVVLIDGRYTIQVKQEIDCDAFQVDHYTETHPGKWAADHLKPGDTCAIDPMLFTKFLADRLRALLLENDVELVYLDENLIDSVWEDQPEDPVIPYRIYEDRIAGQSSKDKRKDLAQKIKSQKADSAFIAAPDSIAWLLNIRGNDVFMSRLPLTYGILYIDGTFDLFCDLNKIEAGLKKHLGSDVRFFDFSQMPDRLASWLGV